MSAVDRIAAALAATGLHRRFSASGPLIVMLHGLAGLDGVAPALFEALLDRLAERRRIVPLSDAVACLGQPEASEIAALTFDDGYPDFAEWAVPILARRGLHATLFVPAGLLGQTNVWDRGYAAERRIMAAAELRALEPAHVELGAHGLTHCRLAALAPQALRAETLEARVRLEQATGRPIRFFAYPYGQLDDFDAAAQAAVEDAGYLAACSTHFGRGSRPDERFRLRRVGIVAQDTPRNIERKLDGAYDWSARKETLGAWLRGTARSLPGRHHTMKIGEPIRVCHLVSDDTWGGLEAVVAGLLRAQSQRSDLRVHLVALNSGRLVRLATELGIPVQVAPEAGRNFLALLRDVDSRIAKIRPQILHSHRYKENLLSYLIGPRHSARSIVTLHGEEAPGRPAVRLALGLRDFLMHRLAHLVGARLAAVSADLRARFLLSAERCVVIPNGVPLPALEVRDPGMAPAGLVIGWAGRLVPIKGLTTLLEAFALLPAGLATSRLLLVGDGPDRAVLAALAAQLGIADRVEFAGFLDDPASWLARMDVFALPSLHEGFPVALLEAMAAGLPCVASAAGGIPELDGGCGAVRLVASREAKDWAAALASVLSNPAERAALGARGRERIAGRFSVETVLARYLELYRSELAG